MQVAFIEFVQAFRNVTRQFRRSAFGVVAVAFGVVALILAVGFIEWIFWAGREGTIQTGVGHLQVMRSGYLEKGHADPLGFLMPQDSPVSKTIAQVPNVRTVAPRLAFNGLISHGDATISFIGEGVDPEKDLDVNGLLPIPAGQNLSSADPEGIVLGAGLARNLGVKVGDRVVLLSNTSGGGINAIECTVRGVFTTASKAYDDGALRAPLPIAQKLLRVSGVHRWVVMLNDTRHTTAVTVALREQFGKSGLEVLAWYDLADFYNKMVALLSRQIDVLRAIIAVIIVLSISNTMMMNVLERTSEIGNCMALGRRRLHLLRQFVYEGLTIGSVGGGIGVALGWLLATLISSVGIPMPPPPGMSEGYTGEILVNVPLTLNALLLAISTALLASLYPAWKASRMEIVEALRHNR